MNKFKMFLFVFCITGQAAFANDATKPKSNKKMTMPSMTTEQRQKMAVAHEKMAVCLRSEKPVGECHEEMMTACQEGMGKEGCSMMNGKGMHHGKMMNHDDSDTKTSM